MYQCNSFDVFYGKSLQTLLNTEPSFNQRTGKMVHELHGLVYECVGGMPLLTLRDINVKFFVAETLWNLAGRSDLEFMHLAGLKGWDQFADKNGIVESAYGRRWRKTFSYYQNKKPIIRDQLAD